MKLGFIGGGNMAAAIIGGLLQKDFSRADIIVTEPQPERRDWLKSEFGVEAVDSTAATLAADVLLLAVKPQQLREVLLGLPALDPGQLVISIAAGVRASDISRWLRDHPTVEIGRASCRERV